MTAQVDEWRQTSLREVVSKLVDGSHNPPSKQEHGFPMLSARNVDDGRIVFDSYRYIEEAAFKQENSRTRITPGDVLLTIVGTIGRTAVVPSGLAPFALQRSVAVLSPKPELLSKFLCYQLQSPAVQRYFEENARGTAQKGVYLKTLGMTPVVLPPLVTQVAVVAELEKQFSRLDEAVVNLQRVKANLKRYKASVLKAAVEGHLVETEATQAHREGRTFEAGEQLLQRTLEERRARWAGKGKYKEPESSVLDGLRPLPEGWAYATTEQMCEQVASGSTPSPEAMFPGAGDVPFLKVYNLTFDGSLDFTMKPTFVDNATHQGMLARSRSIPGDVLMNIVGPPLGKMSIVPASHPEWNINQAIVTFRTSSGLSNQLLAHWLLAQPVLSRLERTAKATAGQHNLQVSICRKLPIPVPPLAEQARIVAEVDRHLSIVREVETEVDTNLKRAQALRQATLAKAFGHA